VSALDDAETVHADDRETWRTWLAANHTTARGVWLVTWRPRTGRDTLAYDAAVEEALCFGWVDSTTKTFDDDRGKQYYSPRKARSPWAATNKARVARLIANGRMTPAGLAVIEQAKANGIWDISDTVERLEIPSDLAAALDRHPGAAANFAGVPAHRPQADALVGRGGAAPAHPGHAGHGDRRGRRPEQARPWLRVPTFDGG
jgi:uncharacterized protein YdeI (YjbR/CyaY-like superfamily)